MSITKQELRKIAVGLMEHESKKNSGEAATPIVVIVCGKLRPQLTALVGNAGFAALLGRALSLAAAESPWIEGVCVEGTGGLTGIEEAMAQMGGEAIAEGSSNLIMQVLHLLVAFIGEDLTRMMLAEAWPDFSTEGTDTKQGGGDEKLA